MIGGRLWGHGWLLEPIRHIFQKGVDNFEIAQNLLIFYLGCCTSLNSEL